MESRSARALGGIDNPGQGEAAGVPASARPRAGVCSHPSRPRIRAALPRFPAEPRSWDRGVAVQAVAVRQGHPPGWWRRTRGGGSGREGHRREGRVTVAPPDPVTSRRARRELRATLVLAAEADSALAGGSWSLCPPSPLARDDRSQVCASWRPTPPPWLLGGK